MPSAAEIDGVTSIKKIARSLRFGDCYLINGSHDSPEENYGDCYPEYCDADSP